MKRFTVEAAMGTSSISPGLMTVLPERLTSSTKVSYRLEATLRNGVTVTINIPGDVFNTDSPVDEQAVSVIRRVAEEMTAMAQGFFTTPPSSSRP